MTLNTYTTRTLWRSLAPTKGQATLRLRRASPLIDQFDEYALGHAEKMTRSTQEEGQGDLSVAGTESAIFVVWQDDLDAAGAPRAPLPNDIIAWSATGAEYMVEGVVNGVLTNTWNCRCVKVVGQ